MEEQVIESETPRAWAKITKSSSKDGGIGYEYGYSSPTGNCLEVEAALLSMRKIIEGLVKG